MKDDLRNKGNFSFRFAAKQSTSYPVPLAMLFQKNKKRKKALLFLIALAQTLFPNIFCLFFLLLMCCLFIPCNKGVLQHYWKDTWSGMFFESRLFIIKYLLITSEWLIPKCVLLSSLWAAKKSFARVCVVGILCGSWGSPGTRQQSGGRRV